MNWDEFAESADRRKRGIVSGSSTEFLWHKVGMTQHLSSVVYSLVPCCSRTQWGLVGLELLLLVSLCIYGFVLHFVGKVQRFMQWSLEMSCLQPEGAHRLLVHGHERPNWGLGTNVTLLFHWSCTKAWQAPQGDTEHGTGFVEILWEIGESSVANLWRIQTTRQHETSWGSRNGFGWQHKTR